MQPYPYVQLTDYASPSPSVVTAVLTTVLGIVTGVYLGFFCILYVVILATAPSEQFDRRGWLLPYLMVQLAGWGIAAIALFVGAVLVILRKPFARWLIVIGSAIILLIVVIPEALVRLVLDEATADVLTFTSLTANGPMEAFLLGLAVVGALGTTVLALLPSTTRYCASRGRPVP